MSRVGNSQRSRGEILPERRTKALARRRRKWDASPVPPAPSSDQTTIIVLADDGAQEVAGRWDGERPWIEPSLLESLLGWEVKPEGLCRGDECVLIGDALSGGEVSLVEAAGLVGRPALADRDGNAVVIGAESALRRRALSELELPDVTLPTLAGDMRSIRSWAGKKKLLVVFASW